MNTEEQIFFTLLRSGLSDGECDLNAFGKITDEVWGKVYKLAENQGLVGVLFFAVEHLPKSQLPNIDMLMDWLGQVEYIANSNDQYKKYAQSFIGLLSGNGFEIFILKGLECAKYYPIPKRRPLGDLDIFPIKGTYDDVNTFCERSGLPVDYHDYKHSKITYKSLTIENHQYCTEIRGDRVKKDFERHLQELLKDVTKDLNYIQFNALFLMAHAFNHFIDEGLSLRQICDWAMFVKNEQANVDWKDFYLWMNQMHMSRFADALNAITVADLNVTISNDIVVTSSVYKDKVLHEALYGHRHLHSQGLTGLRYRIAQLRNTYIDKWKYHDICQQNVFVEYMKEVGYYFMERNPKL